MSATLEGTDRPLHEEFDLALVDLDGVTYRGPEAIPSAPPAIAAAREAGMRIVYVTNNASRDSVDVAAHLTDLGMPASSDEVLTAAQTAALVLRDTLDAGARVLVVGAEGLRTAVADQGFAVVDEASEEPAAVVQGWGPDVGWRALAEASYAIRGGAYYLATNRDLTLPTHRGLAPGNGALVQAVATASGVEPESSGKPAPTMFRLAAERAGARRPLVIGDRLDTDLAGARAAAFPGLLVLTGVSGPRDLLLAGPDERPTFVGETLACLAEPHPAPTPADGGWSVGDARAHVRGGRLEAEGGAPIDRLRAACAAAWDAADRGEVAHIEGGGGDGLW